MMSRETLLDRIAKAEEFISKKNATISKKEALISKKLDNLRKLGFDWTEERLVSPAEFMEQGYPEADARELYGQELDIDYIRRDIGKLIREMSRKQDKLLEYSTELEKVERRDEEMAKEVPEAFRQARDELVERWTEYDIQERNQMFKDSKEMEYKEYCKKYTYSRRDYLHHTDEEFRRLNSKAADAWLIDLYYRVKAITGTITDAKNLRFAGKSLNGIVYGEDGNARVETIGAGGYNIQRYHLRVLVHKF